VRVWLAVGHTDMRRIYDAAGRECHAAREVAYRGARQFYLTHQHRHGRGHVMVPRSRFLPDEVLGLFTRRTTAPNCAADAMPLRPAAPVDIGARLRGMWS
jgi:hypothetical protein